MEPFNLLSEPIREYIRKKRWKSLRPIQGAAIEKITYTLNNYILASRTASGKTEAAFLPILSKVDFQKKGVQILYISPLIALINDQFYRIEELCKYLDIPVTKWHGEANKTLKNKLLQTPEGIVLITPESLEAMFVNAPQNIKGLFSELQYIVIDEIHSFLGTNRGLQLMSLLSRIQQANCSKIVIIGLSATIGCENYKEIKLLTGDPKNTTVLMDLEKKETQVVFKYFECNLMELPQELLEDLYEETKDHKVLLFPNTRGRTEEIAVKLKKISKQKRGHNHYYSHHSSVHKEVREEVENFAKNNERYNFCIVCTSTLELGIDIGTVDMIVQIDATHSISSLVQRIGRSGRRDGEKSILTLYATDQWSLLQSLACWNLYEQDFLEPISIFKKPYDILLHQILSIIKQVSGCPRSELFHRIKINPTFDAIADNDIKHIIEELIKSNYLEDIGKEIILGIKGEKIVNSQNFYSMFINPKFYQVIASGRNIGEIPPSLQIQKDQNIFLAAKIWKIQDVDVQNSKIYVKPANDGKAPLFYGDAGDLHPKVREEMLRILKKELVKENSKITLEAFDAIRNLQKNYSKFRIKHIDYERPLINKGESIEIYTFTGSKINKSIVFLCSIIEKKVDWIDKKSLLKIPVKKDYIKILFQEIISLIPNINEHLYKTIEANPNILSFSKWAQYLPIQYQCEILKEQCFDFEGTVRFLENIQFIESK